MLDYPTTAFVSYTPRTVAGILLAGMTLWLGLRLHRLERTFIDERFPKGRDVTTVVGELVAAPPPALTTARPFPYWTVPRVHAAQHWLTLDCLFAFAYSAFASVVCGWLSQQTRLRWLVRAGAMLSWLVLVGAAVDLAENAAIAGLLADQYNALARSLAQLLGVVKWIAPGAASLYALVWLAIGLPHRLRTRR